MKKGELVPDFLSLIYICKLGKMDVYISKRALKHFVESRSGELINNYPYEMILPSLYFILDNIENVLFTNNIFETMNGRLYYTKHFQLLRKPSIRIVLERIDNHFEIVTMHYKKIKSTT